MASRTVIVVDRMGGFSFYVRALWEHTLGRLFNGDPYLPRTLNRPFSSYGLELPYALGAASWSFGGQGDAIHSGPVRPGVEDYLLQSGRFNYDMTNGTLQPFTFAYEGAARGAKASAAAPPRFSTRPSRICATAMSYAASGYAPSPAS